MVKNAAKTLTLITLPHIGNNANGDRWQAAVQTDIAVTLFLYFSPKFLILYLIHYTARMAQSTCLQQKTLSQWREMHRNWTTRNICSWLITNTVATTSRLSHGSNVSCLLVAAPRTSMVDPALNSQFCCCLLGTIWWTQCAWAMFSAFRYSLELSVNAVTIIWCSL